MDLGLIDFPIHLLCVKYTDFDFSDADVEDNLESDISRCNTFGILSTINDSSSDLQDNKNMTESMESHDKIDGSQLTSSTSTLQADSLSSNITDVPNTGSNLTLNEFTECGTSLSNDIGKSESVEGKDIVKPKLIANATFDDVGAELVNGYCHEEMVTDETFNKLNGGHYAKFTCCDTENAVKNDIANDRIKNDCDLVNGHAEGVGTHKITNGELRENLENLTLSENGAVNSNELTSGLENLTVNDHNVPIYQNGTNDIHELNENRKQEVDGRHVDFPKHTEEESEQRGQKGAKVSPPLSRQGSAKHVSTKRNLKKAAQVKSTTMLGQHYIPSSRECSVMSCLHQFTSAELLTGNNKFGCANCTKIRDRHHPSKGK